jgi:hypothetical protein
MGSFGSFELRDTLQSCDCSQEKKTEMVKHPGW